MVHAQDTAVYKRFTDTFPAGYCDFVVNIYIIYQILVILMLRILSLVKFGPGVTNPL